MADSHHKVLIRAVALAAWMLLMIGVAGCDGGTPAPATTPAAPTDSTASTDPTAPADGVDPAPADGNTSPPVTDAASGTDQAPTPDDPGIGPAQDLSGDQGDVG